MGAKEEVAVMFDTAFLSLERALGERFDTGLRNELRALGVDFAHLQPAYPVATWEKVLDLLAARLFASEAREYAFRRIGQAFVRGYVQTPMGQATLVVGKMLGVRRMMHRMGRNFRTATNLSLITATDLNEHSLEIIIEMAPQFLSVFSGRPLSLPYYRLGLLEETLVQLGANGAVSMREVDLTQQRAVYRVTWA